MKPRSQRRRDERQGEPGPPLAAALSRNGVLIAGFIGVGVAIIVVGIVLLAGGGGDDNATEDNGVQPFPDGSTPIPVVSPTTEDEIELERLARRLIELLPAGQWPALYEDFTDEFKARCSRDAFIESGNLSAQEQGEQLTLIQYAGIESYSVQETTASLVVVGQVGVINQYTVRADFEKVEGAWRISPVPDSDNCDAFSRLSD